MIDIEKCIAIEGEVENFKEAIYLCGKGLQEKGFVNQEFSEACIQREQEYPTGLPSSIPVAIPHSLCDGIKESSICFLRLKKPVTFKRMDDAEQTVETQIVLNLAIKESGKHIQFLQKLMCFIMEEEAMRVCLESNIEEIPAYLCAYLKGGSNE